MKVTEYGLTSVAATTRSTWFHVHSRIKKGSLSSGVNGSTIMVENQNSGTHHVVQDIGKSNGQPGCEA